MEIGSLVRDKILNRIGIVTENGLLGTRVGVRWSDGNTFWALVRNLEVICK